MALAGNAWAWAWLDWPQNRDIAARAAPTKSGRKLSMAKLLGISTAIAGAVFALASSYDAEAGEFDGVTVNIMTQTGAIQEPLQRRAPEFEKMTGAKINVIAVPFSDLYQKVLTDWASGTNSVDAAVFAPQWMVDYVSGGYLEDLGPRIAKDQAIKWDEIGAVLPQFLGDLRRQDLSRSARWRLPHALLPDRRLRESGPEAAEDLGRISRRRQGAERQRLQRQPRSTAPASPRSATRKAIGSSPTSPARWSSRRARARARSSTPRT